VRRLRNPAEALAPTVAPEQHLWCAAVVLAISDADTAGPAGKGDRASVRESARRWLSSRSPSLMLALTACGIDVDAWHSRCLPALRRRWDAEPDRGAPPDPAHALKLRKAGWTHAAIADELRLSTVTVRKILRRAEQQNAQAA
jgi:hypothetical protein